jgi:glycosyltransferase involved in cell wall biosynthesis
MVSGATGGVEQFVIGLAAGLSQLDHGDEEYLFLTYDDAADWLAPHMGGACRFLPVGPPPPTPTWRQIAGRVQLVRRMRDEWIPPVGPFRPRIHRSSGLIERAGIEVMHLTCQSGFLTAVPSIYHPHDLQHLHLPAYFARRERVVRDVTYRSLCKGATMVAVASEWVRRDLIAHYGIDADKIYVIPLASPVQTYQEPSGSDAERLRSSFHLPDDFLLYPAQTWPHKNHLALLRALHILRSRHGLDVPLVCTGQTTPHLRTIRAHADQLDLSDHVTFTGFVSPTELVCLYRLCRAVVVPTLFEAGSFPVLEAFTLGAPVACSNVTSLPEQAGDAALLFDPRAPEEIAEAIRRLWTDPRLRSRLIARGRARISARTWRATAQTFRAHYRRIAGRELLEEDRELVLRSSTP